MNLTQVFSPMCRFGKMKDFSIFLPCQPPPTRMLFNFGVVLVLVNGQLIVTFVKKQLLFLFLLDRKSEKNRQCLIWVKI